MDLQTITSSISQIEKEAMYSNHMPNNLQVINSSISLIEKDAIYNNQQQLRIAPQCAESELESAETCDEIDELLRDMKMLEMPLQLPSAPQRTNSPPQKLEKDNPLELEIQRNISGNSKRPFVRKLKLVPRTSNPLPRPPQSLGTRGTSMSIRKNRILMSL